MKRSNWVAEREEENGKKYKRLHQEISDNKTVLKARAFSLVESLALPLCHVYRLHHFLGHSLIGNTQARMPSLKLF